MAMLLVLIPVLGNHQSIIPIEDITVTKAQHGSSSLFKCVGSLFVMMDSVSGV